MENKKKWYKTWWCIILLVLFWPFSISYWIWKQKWQLRTRVIILVVLWGILVFAGRSPEDKSKTAVAVDTRCVGPDGKRIGLSPEECQKFNDAWKNRPQEKPSSVPLSYKIVEKQENKTVTNYKVLITPGDDAKAILMDVKKTCSMDCNISVYDDNKALELDQQYGQLIANYAKPDQLQAWKRNNYVFVADHFPAFMSFDTKEYQAYPYKDWYYKELKK